MQPEADAQPRPAEPPRAAIRTRAVSLVDVPLGALARSSPLVQVIEGLVDAPVDHAGGSLHAVGSSGAIHVAPHVSRPVAGLYVSAPTDAIVDRKSVG